MEAAIHTNAAAKSATISHTDSGAYGFASSTTYVAGKAIIAAAEKLRTWIIAHGAAILGCETEELKSDGARVYRKDHPEQYVPLKASLSNFPIMPWSKSLPFGEMGRMPPASLVFTTIDASG